MNVHQFREHMTKYFSITVYDKAPKITNDFFENRSQRFNSLEFYREKAAVNIVKVNISEFLKLSRLNIPLLKENPDRFEVYIYEYVLPYYQRFRNNNHEYAHAEVIYDLYILDKEQDKVVSYLELRLGINDFASFFQHGFIGMIHIEHEFKKNKLSTFMLRVSSSFLWFKQRKKMYSGTLISDEFLPVLHHLSKKTKWIERDDYYNEYSSKPQERYCIKPVQFRVKVKDNQEVLEF